MIPQPFFYQLVVLGNDVGHHQARACAIRDAIVCAVAVKAAGDRQAGITVLANPGVHLRVAMRQGALIQDGCVVAERRLRLGCSLYQRDESLQSLSPPPIIEVDTRRWGRLLVGHTVSPLSL